MSTAGSVHAGAFDRTKGWHSRGSLERHRTPHLRRRVHEGLASSRGGRPCGERSLSGRRAWREGLQSPRAKVALRWAQTDGAPRAGTPALTVRGRSELMRVPRRVARSSWTMTSLRGAATRRREFVGPGEHNVSHEHRASGLSPSGGSLRASRRIHAGSRFASSLAEGRGR
jgi:hypothetical protein